ncbi:MAG TPA: hypothetical protein VFE63_12520 [Roseiarcus sp.]|jgi:hypothetical protein|nr:hypothetical protein [Roseiarcus sp.]
MSLALPSAARPVASERSEARVSGLVLALVAVFLFAVSAFSPAVLRDGDTWSHLATGEWMLAHGAVPRVDPFSHSMPGAPWTAHEWASEILMALAFRWGGWNGVALLTAAAASGAALIMGLRVARDLSGAALGVTVALGVALWLPNLLARPHVLALPLAAAWAVGLIDARERDAAPPVRLAALMILWSNMHGGFVFGLALIGPFALEAVAAAPRGERLAALRGWTLFGLAALAASLVNPYGLEALLFPFRLMGVVNLSRISEWRAQDFSQVGPMEIALILVLGFALTRPMATPPVRAALLAGLLAMALQHARHAQLLGLVAPMLLARPIAGAIGAPWPQGSPEAARVALTASLAAALGLSALRIAEPIVRTDGPAAPISALAAVPPELRAKPVLNGYDFGGYLIWSGVRPFIDGRADMYGDAMLGRYRKLAAADPATVEESMSRYRIAWTIFSPDEPIVAVLDRAPGWRRLYGDGVAVVHVRDGALSGP